WRGEGRGEGRRRTRFVTKPGYDAGTHPIAEAAAMASMTLYTAGTGNGQRAAIAVNECDVPCTIHVLNLGQGDQKKPDYLKLNPTGRIPTLIDPDGPGGKPLTVTQSWAVLFYLCEKTGKFLPQDPAARV